MKMNRIVVESVLASKSQGCSQVRPDLLLEMRLQFEQDYSRHHAE